ERWRGARDLVQGGAEATALAHPFAGLTAHLLLSQLWTVMQARAETHPDPARIRRLASAALTEARIGGEAAHAFILAACEGVPAM
ncbi:hypothetical protein HKCCSP123_14395, partial [Rhodobacterales bacterium HKCCSP123]|nr:hypothetical protein [Rhodobacterales bacterium HKCCSP123]